MSEHADHKLHEGSLHSTLYEAVTYGRPLKRENMLAPHLYNICTMLEQQCRRWADVVLMLLCIYVIYVLCLLGTVQARKYVCINYREHRVFFQFVKKIINVIVSFFRFI